MILWFQAILEDVGVRGKLIAVLAIHALVLVSSAAVAGGGQHHGDRGKGQVHQHQGGSNQSCNAIGINAPFFGRYSPQAHGYAIIPRMDEHSAPVKRLLVIRLGALGDVANTLRAVNALRESISPVYIGWLVESTAVDLVDAAGVADEIIVFQRKQITAHLRSPSQWPKAVGEIRNLRRRLHEACYTCVLDFQGNFKSAMLGLLSGARDRIGFARAYSREMNWLFNNMLAMPAKARLPRAEKFAALAQVLDPDLDLGPVSLRHNLDSASYIEEFLSSAAPGEGPLVVLHPGTSAFGAFKRWPPDRFGEVASRLRDAMNARCVVTAGPGEEALAAEVASASGGAAHVVPLLTISRLIELLRKAALIVAGDTGPLHIASLLERPTVGIFGPKDPVIYAPYGAYNEIVRADVECSTCTRRKCADLRCINEIAVEQVVEAAKRALSKHPLRVAAAANESGATGL